MLECHVRVGAGLIAQVAAQNLGWCDAESGLDRCRYHWRVALAAPPRQYQGTLVHDRADGWYGLLTAILAAAAPLLNRAADAAAPDPPEPGGAP